MSTNLKIVIAEPSSIIRSGLEVMMKKISGFRIQIIEVVSTDSLPDTLRLHRPDILILNPLLYNVGILSQLKEEVNCPDMKCFAMVYSAMEPSYIRMFDDRIELFDETEDIKRKLEQVVLKEIAEESETEDSQSLSIREREIVVCVVKGMTNREIADKLYLSTHTVITHRRNIARKLQIHSASGLTVYAIVNKLVELDDIQPRT